MRSDTPEQKVQKRVIQEEILTEYGVLIPSIVLAGATVAQLLDIKGILHDAAVRFLREQASDMPERVQQVEQGIVDLSEWPGGAPGEALPRARPERDRFSASGPG
jgi:hypothetical protein